ncbi:uncharacterized protein LAESUDRAFT_294420 [Laetiporus sulphureus 93-53]|uniref:Uncharacterized protein n=1 Tax=Laetiporus sulphureus 93-53 TaxID=1314785 RepID=A0A165DAI7_9APHY|nr:uncharacterized protein LAESUDRAFT_294420 [Laetiporus sulphureus 93-53]KZT04440.1 hypothetical protein LAESUDRAFT_294420 [Laetiporus sulphureus 93-53]
MEDCPAEIWARIFSLACTDGGYTGQSLSQVSRYFHQTSRPIQLQSISLSGVGQMYEFLNVLQSRPRELQIVLHLFISSQDLPRKRPYVDTESLKSFSLWELVDHLVHDLHDSDNEHYIKDVLERAGYLQTIEKSRLIGERRSAFSRVLLHLLKIVAPHLKSFTLYCAELTLHSGLSVRTNFNGISSQVRTLPSLTHLRILGDTDCSDLFLGRVPSLTHLQFTGITHLPFRTRDAIFASIKPSSISTEPQETTAGFPPLDRVIMRLNNLSRGGLACSSTVSSFEKIARTNEKFVLLKPFHESKWVQAVGFIRPSRGTEDETWFSYGIQKAKEEWLDRIAGYDGCWEVGSMGAKTRKEMVSRRLHMV